MFLKNIKEPIVYQGRKKSRNYFEGWYFKHVSADLKETVSVIPGIAKDTHDPHAFIQTIINVNGLEPRLETHYHRFPAEDFRAYDKPFGLRIGRNTFCCNGMELDLQDDKYSLEGKIQYSEFDQIKISPLFPNSMGYFAYLPFMECYHGIVSMSHSLAGYLTLNSERFDFTGGKGYIEKDWGTSFPQGYVWVQSNHFGDSDASIMCSIADVPFLGVPFRGFICILTFGGREYRFASYNLSTIVKMDCKAGRFAVVLAKDGLQLAIRAKTAESGLLKAPKGGRMNAAIKEGLSGTVDVRLINSAGQTVFRGTGNPCGIEMVNTSRLCF